VSAVLTPTAADLDRELERHRAFLITHCQRILGPSEAEDAVQETIVRAWRSHDRFEGRASMRTWLCRIATNVCLDMASAKQRRARPSDVLDPHDADTGPAPGRRVPVGAAQAQDDDPADRAVARERVRHALVAALLHLPSRQRSVLILRDVLRWRASEVAELLGTTVASANSALARARATMAATAGPERDADLDPERRELLRRWTDAFERHDLDALATMLA
jgi:RNA polymerase sigma-70 factor (ECF subfamily)